MSPLFILSLFLLSFSSLAIDVNTIPPLLGASNLNMMDILGSYCQSSGRDPIQCGSGNCESWTTGSYSQGSNAGRLYCNNNGLFCDSGNNCYYPCMDKSADTKVLSFQYGNPSSPTTIPDAVFTHYINNDLNTHQVGSYQWQESVTNSYQWSWSQTASVSDSLTVDVGLPDICTVHDTITVSISSTDGQTKTSSTTKTWSATQNYDASPQQTIKLVYIVNRVKYDVPFTQTVQFGGQVAFWCSNAVDGHHFWMPYVGSILYNQPNCQGNICTFSGVFTGVQGIKDSVTYSYCPLNTEC